MSSGGVAAQVKERVKNVEKAQQVGGFSVMHIEDLRQVAPLWLKWTEEVRADPESWGNTGDIFNANGKAGPPWIAEMYGYVFACAEVGLDFKARAIPMRCRCACVVLAAAHALTLYAGERQVHALPGLQPARARAVARGAFRVGLRRMLPHKLRT